MIKKNITVKNEEAGQRLDQYLSQKVESLSRTRVKNLITNGDIKVNGLSVKARYIVVPNDNIYISLPAPAPSLIMPEPIDINIVFEDKYLIVLDKQPGIIVHPAGPVKTGTLINGLLFHCKNLSGIGGVERPGIVHRLDKETSGLMLVAKDDNTHNYLSNELKERNISKTYLAVVSGYLKRQSGIIKTLIARHPVNRKKMAVVPLNGREAITEYQLCEKYNKASLVRVNLLTGRTHQIRVHMAYLGHPVLGDKVYGGLKPLNKSNLISRQALHSAKIEFKHPASKEMFSFSSDIPEDMVSLINKLKTP